MNALLMTNSHNHRSINNFKNTTNKSWTCLLQQQQKFYNWQSLVAFPSLLLTHWRFTFHNEKWYLCRWNSFIFFSSCTCNHIILLGEEKIFKKNNIEELSIIWRVECEAMKVGLPHFFSFPSSPHLSHLCKCIRARLSSQ